MWYTIMTEDDSPSTRSRRSIGGSAVGRRKFLTAASAATAFGLAGCSGQGGNATKTTSGKPFKGETLRVTVWSGFYQKAWEATIKPLFEEKTGATLQVQGGWADILSKIRAAPEDSPPYDVATVEGQFYHFGRQEDLFEPVRKENVPNYDDLLPYYKDLRSTEYQMPLGASGNMLVVREDLDVDPDSWGFFHTDAADDLGVGMDTGFPFLVMTSVALGSDAAERDQELYDDQYHDALFDELNSWGIDAFAAAGPQIWKLFDNGVIDAAQWYFNAYRDLPEGIKGIWPEPNGGWGDHYAIVRNTPKRRLAEELLDFLMSTEAQNEFITDFPLVMSNSNVQYPDDLQGVLPTTDGGPNIDDMLLPDYKELTENEHYSPLRQRYKDFVSTNE